MTAIAISGVPGDDLGFVGAAIEAQSANAELNTTICPDWHIILHTQIL